MPTKKTSTPATTQHSISDCTFYGVKFDEKAIDAVNIIAKSLIANSDAIIENAKAANKLINVLSASNVNIEAMIKIDNPK